VVFVSASRKWCVVVNFLFHTTDSKTRGDESPSDALRISTKAVESLLSIDVPQLLSRCLGNRDLARRLIERFQISTSELEIKIEKALSELQLEEASLLAHRLKGEAANLGANLIRENSASIEDACRELQLPIAVGALADLKQNNKLLQEQLPVLIQNVATSDPDPKLSCLPKRQPR